MAKNKTSETDQTLNDEVEETEETSEEQPKETEEEVEEEEEVVEEEHEEKVPYSRFKDVIEERNNLRSLTETLTQIASQNKNLTPHDKGFEWPEGTDVETRKAIESYYDKKTGADRSSTEQILGGVLDKLDEVKAFSSRPDIKKHLNAVETLRKEFANKGVYLTREDAFDMLVGRGTIKSDKSGKTISVKKTNVKVSTEKSGVRGESSDTTSNKKKGLSKMSDEELTKLSDKDLEKAMENVRF